MQALSQHILRSHACDLSFTLSPLTHSNHRYSSISPGQAFLQNLHMYLSLAKWNVLTKELQRNRAKRVIDRHCVSEFLCKQSVVFRCWCSRLSLSHAQQEILRQIRHQSSSFVGLLKVDQNAVAWVPYSLLNNTLKSVTILQPASIKLKPQ